MSGRPVRGKIRRVVIVIVDAQIHGLSGTADELVRIVNEYVSALVDAEGCLSVAASTPLHGDLGELILTTRWTGEQAMQAHYASPDYSRYVEDASALLARPSDVRISYVERDFLAVDDPSLDPTRQG